MRDPMAWHPTAEGMVNLVGHHVAFELPVELAAEDAHDVLGGEAKGAVGEEPQVDECKRATIVGQEGRLRLIIISVRAVDDQNIPIRTSASREGESQMGTAVGVGLFCPAAFLMKGERSNFPVTRSK
jgi:hypothetical protein